MRVLGHCGRRNQDLDGICHVTRVVQKSGRIGT
jgi:hypothetical protein